MKHDRSNSYFIGKSLIRSMRLTNLNRTLVAGRSIVNNTTQLPHSASVFWSLGGGKIISGVQMRNSPIDPAKPTPLPYVVQDQSTFDGNTTHAEKPLYLFHAMPREAEPA